MGIHIEAKPGEIAETVLLPGDPLRAKHIAETYLENVNCYNEVRGMLGFTGNYNGKRVSIQGSGMGIPSTAIYVSELIDKYKVKRIIRVGTCGAIREDLKVGDIILAMAASTESSFNRIRFKGMDYAPIPSFVLLHKAYETAVTKGIPVRVGGVLTNDSFYHDDPGFWKLWSEYGILALEMESTAIYTLAAKNKVDALTILTVSDNLVSGQISSAEERQTSFNKMTEIALELIN